MKAALFFDGSEDFPESLPLVQSIVGDVHLIEAYKASEVVKLEASKQRGRINIRVREAYRRHFGSLLDKRWELKGRIYKFLSKVEAYYFAVEGTETTDNCLAIFSRFKLPLQEDEIYKFSGDNGAELIWLKTALRSAIDDLVPCRMKFEVLLMVSMGDGGSRKIVTENICDAYSRRIPCPWALEIVPVLETDLLTAARVCANSIVAIGTNFQKPDSPRDAALCES